MTPEQVNTLLFTLFEGLSKVGTIVVAVVSLWFQARRERERADQMQIWRERETDQQRSWSVEDRNISRKWNLSDRQIEEKREQFLQHKRFVDEYIRTLLVLTSRAYMRSTGFEKDTLDQLATSYLLSLDQSAEVYYHIEAFGSSELRQEFQSLMETVDEYLVPVIREPEKNQDKVGNLRGVMAGTAGGVAKTMENIMIEELQTRDWE